MYSSSSFQVRISSNDSDNICRENNASSFFVQLPHELLLPGNDWEVALSALHYPSRIDPKPILCQKNNFWMHVITNKSHLVQHRPITLTFEPDEITNGETMANSINLKMGRDRAEGILKASIAQTGNLMLEAGKDLTINLSPLFSLVVGGGTALKEGHNYYEIFCKEGTKTFFPGLVKLERCLPQNMVLFCDIISPVIMGGKYSKILKVIQVAAKDDKTKYTTYESNHLEFVDVASDRVQSMNFQLSTISGDPITFLDAKSPSLVTIMFRKKEK